MSDATGHALRDWTRTQTYTWFCTNCCEDWPEPHCDMCGRPLSVAFPTAITTAARSTDSTPSAPGGKEV